MRKNRSQGFTLIEVLIVVVIMAILAATVIPQFSSSTNDARESAVTFNAHSLRTQIEMYKVHHLGEYPTIQSGDLPQLTKKTNADGDIGTGESYPFGPYVTGELPNPYNDSNTVVAGTGAAVVTGGAGWQYDVNTGGIWPNNEEYFEQRADRIVGGDAVVCGSTILPQGTEPPSVRACERKGVF